MTFVNATTLDVVRIDCLGESRAVNMPARLIVDVRDALVEADIEAMLVDVGKAINANNGQCCLVEEVLCRMTSLLTRLMKAGD